jgi:uncharacterized membrane protein
MAVSQEAVAVDRDDRGFFVVMAVALGLSAAAGFGSWALRGFVVQPVPLHVHVHAALFVAWIAMFISQTILARRGSFSLHRRLGWFALLLAGAMIVAGVYAATQAVQLGRVPPFFPANIFLSLSFLELATFAALLAGAIALRRKTDWHRRLMLGATIALIGPAWGRVLPMPDLGPMGGFAIMGAQLAYVAVAIAYDLAQKKPLHGAYLWAIAAITVQALGTPLLANAAPIVALAQSLQAH